MKTEIWKDIEGYEWKYQVSNLWNIKSLNYRLLWYSKLLKCSRLWNYYWIILCNNWIQNKFYVHRLVAESFLWKSHLTVNHIDGDKNNNCINNLEFISQRENNIHARKLWLNINKKWSDNILSKKVMQTDLSWNIIWVYWSAREASRILNIPPWNIINVCNKKPKYNTAKWFIFKYL